MNSPRENVMCLVSPASYVTSMMHSSWWRDRASPDELRAPRIGGWLDMVNRAADQIGDGCPRSADSTSAYPGRRPKLAPKPAPRHHPQVHRRATSDSNPHHLSDDQILARETMNKDHTLSEHLGRFSCNQSVRLKCGATRRYVRKILQRQNQRTLSLCFVESACSRAQTELTISVA